MSTANNGLHAASEKLSQLQQQIASIPQDPKETAEQISALRSLLISFPKHPGGEDDWSFALIRSMAANGQADASRRAAHVLSASGIPLGIRLRGSGNGSADFIIGTARSSEGTLQHILKSTLRVLDLREYKPQQEDYALDKTAACTVVSRAGAAAYSSAWPDDLIRLSCSGRCQVSMDFYPIPAGDSWLAQHSAALAQVHDRLMVYSDAVAQITDNTGKKRLPQNPADNCEVTASMTKRNILARHGAALADTEFERLQQILQSGGWMAQLRIQTDDPALMEALQAVFSSNLMTHGLDCRWEDDVTPRIGLLMPKQDLPALLSFPGKAFPGLSMEQAHGYNVNLPVSGSEEGVQIGNLVWQDSITASRFRIPTAVFMRHIGLFGTAGAGKTCAVRTILTAMQDVPSLILEPGKLGYRNLADADLYTMEAGSDQQLQINPFWFPDGGSLQYHIHILTQLLCAVIKADAVAAGILEQCISKTYSDMGWNLVTSRNYYCGLFEDEKLYPTFSQLCETVERYFDKIAYEVTMQTYKHAILNLLRSFTIGAYGSLLNGSVVTPVAKWIRGGKRVVLELGGLADDHARRIAAGTLLAQYCQYIRGNTEPSDMLKHLLVLDDAQWLFGACSGTDALLRDILTQLPDFGVGVLTAARTPLQLPPEVISRIDGRIVFRSVGREEVSCLCDDLLLDASDGTLQTLAPGCALVRLDGMKKPALVRLDAPPIQPPQLPVHQVMAEQPIEVAEHLLDTSSELRSLLYSLMEPLYYQVLFDNDRDNLSKALSESLYSVIREALMHHTLVDMLSGMDLDAVIVQLIETVFAVFIRSRTELGYCLQNMVEMYTSRILQLTAGGGTLRSADWRALMDYRSFMLDSRFLEMFRRSKTTMMTRLRESVGVSSGMELIAALLEEAYNSDRRNSTDEELYEDILPTLNSMFLKIPDENRVKEELFKPVCNCLRGRKQ